MLLAAGDDVPYFEILAWSAVLVVLVVVGMAFVLRLKRRMKQDEEDDAPVPVTGFTLSDVRQMHRAGQLTDEEFAKAKEKIVAAAQKVAERIPAQGNPQRDSADMIRARRLARETQKPENELDGQ